MFYFFQRGTAYVRCEIRPAGGSGACEIIIDEEDKAERAEQYDSWEAADARWHEIQERFQHEGWQGPLGRE